MATDQMIHVNAEKETHIDITSKYLNFSSRVYIVMLTSDAPAYFSSNLPAGEKSAASQPDM